MNIYFNFIYSTITFNYFNRSNQSQAQEKLSEVHAQLFIPTCYDNFTHIEGRKVSLAHTQTDNLGCIFSMVSWAMHFTVKNDISNKAASPCQSVAGWLLCLGDLAAAISFLDELSQIQH